MAGSRGKGGDRKYAHLQASGGGVGMGSMEAYDTTASPFLELHTPFTAW